MPSSWYTDSAITRWETERIFRRRWCYLRLVSELSALGDYVTGTVGEIPVVAVRNEGGLAAFGGWDSVRTSSEEACVHAGLAREARSPVVVSCLGSYGSSPRLSARERHHRVS